MPQIWYHDLAPSPLATASRYREIDTSVRTPGTGSSGSSSGFGEAIPGYPATSMQFQIRAAYLSLLGGFVWSSRWRSNPRYHTVQAVCTVKRHFAVARIACLGL